ncbi:MAG: sigma-70 family RNA polymerase sigma factor [Burkholderiales bacterium]
MTNLPNSMQPDDAPEEATSAALDLAFGDSGLSFEPDMEDTVLAEADEGTSPSTSPRRPLAPDVDDSQLNQWIAAITLHDEKALAALYDATMSRVFGMVLRIVRKRALAEEVVEDTFFQVWRQAARFDPSRGRAITWLLGMARSRAIDGLRREARFQCDSLDEASSGGNATDLPDHSPAADELLDTARHHADLHRALTLLNTQPRQLVAMAFLQGLSHEEIATQTLLPLGTVKSQIRRALLTLRELLGDHTLLAMRKALP